ncbi:MAG TPA: ATP synthase F1 subunit epsilon [Candidatus Angelobacter sp.]
MASTLKLEIATPEGNVYSGDAEWVTLQTADGQITILPQHVRLITQLKPGEMIVRKGRSEEYLAVGEGLADVSADRVAIVTDMAVSAEKIDEAAIEEARQRAAARLHEKISAEELASVNASLARSLVQLNIKRRHHS